jgi:uroporphyrinogen-III synthase
MSRGDETAPGGVDSPVVLVPRGGDWGQRVTGLLTGCGLTGWILPLIRTDLAESDRLMQAQQALSRGDYDWVALTSAAAVPALPPQVQSRIAAVGPATDKALRDGGYAVDLTPSSDYSADGMLAQWNAAGRILLLRSELAASTLADGLVAAGCRVDDVVAYRTRPAEVSASDRSQLQAGRADAALVTSGSVARALADLGPPTKTRIACLGPRTAAATREAGLQVAAVAQRQQIEALVEAVCDLKPEMMTKELPR